MLQLKTFNERMEYLYLGDKLCHETFGKYRYLNQQFYTSPEWRHLRNGIILRDKACDLGIDGLEIRKHKIMIHHINPITIDDLINRSPKLFDPNNLITMSQDTHNYIHYGTNQSEFQIVERFLNDTCPWKV